LQKLLGRDTIDALRPPAPEQPPEKVDAEGLKMSKDGFRPRGGGNRKAAEGRGKAAAGVQGLLIERTAARIRHKLLVMSGKGGVGKSSVSAHLSVGLARRGMRVGLLDVDLHGPSIAGIMGLSGAVKVTTDRFAAPRKGPGSVGVISIQFLLAEPDRAVIWRGPAKTAAIRQFMADVQWGDLDYLVIDAPPGTGDEPLGVARSVPGARAILVTTPQQVALDDVRRSIRFCRAVELPILGLIENMGPFSCPHCGGDVAVFRQGGGRELADETGIGLIGSLPFDPAVVRACDGGLGSAARIAGPAFAEALEVCIDRVVDLTENPKR
jgi:Mrp family chromosome partitioning ATPase